jgi:transcriptional regulator with XRE-family HTH domain
MASTERQRTNRGISGYDFARMPGPETIGERLRRLREEQGLTQRDLIAPGVSAQYISKIERGQRNASVKALRKIAPKLGITAQYLETGSDVPETDQREFWLDDAELALRLGGDPEGLEAALQEAVRSAESAGHAHAATRARLVLGALASRRGDHQAAIDHLESATAADWVRPLTHADAFTTLGHSYVVAGREQDAVALVRRCLDDALAAEPVDGAAVTRFATHLSYFLADMGELEEARRVIDVALEHARDSADPYTTIRLFWSRARLAAHEGDYYIARIAINRAIGLLESTEDTSYLARAHLLAAEISLWDGNTTEAAEHLESAERILPPDAEVQDLAYLLIQQAFVAARKGDPAEGVDRANEAIAMLGAREDATIRGRAHWALAESFAAMGAEASARSEFTRAAELIPPGSKHSARLLEAWQRLAPADA